MFGHGYAFTMEAALERRARRLALYRAAWWCGLFALSGAIWAGIFWLGWQVTR